MNVVQTLNVASYIFIPLVSCNKCCILIYNMDSVKRIWYLSPMWAAKVQASLRIRAVSPGPSLLAHTSSESRGTFRQKARSLAPLNRWACAVKICHDRMLEDTNSLDGAHIIISHNLKIIIFLIFDIDVCDAYISTGIHVSCCYLPDVNAGCGTNWVQYHSYTILLYMVM